MLKKIYQICWLAKPFPSRTMLIISFRDDYNLIRYLYTNCKYIQSWRGWGYAYQRL